MKSTLKFLTLCLTAAVIISSCTKDDTESGKIIVKIGAQANTTIGSFYSIGQNKVYMQDLAATNQDTIDILCFYEHDEINDHINDISLSSPGAGITGVFTGETSPETWTTQNLTKFLAPVPAITAEEFDLLDQNDATIESYFDNTVVSGFRKATLLAVNDIYAIKTHNSIYGLLKVISVVQGADGYVEFELKLKK